MTVIPKGRVRTRDKRVILRGDPLTVPVLCHTGGTSTTHGSGLTAQSRSRTWVETSPFRGGLRTIWVGTTGRSRTTHRWGRSLQPVPLGSLEGLASGTGDGALLIRGTFRGSVPDLTTDPTPSPSPEVDRGVEVGRQTTEGGKGPGSGRRPRREETARKYRSRRPGGRTGRSSEVRRPVEPNTRAITRSPSLPGTTLVDPTPRSDPLLGGVQGPRVIRGPDPRK